MAGDPATEMYRTRTDALTTDRGDGPPIVFAHGTLMDRTMFDHQVSGLADGYRAVAYDLRARTPWFAPGYDLETLAADCAALLDGLGEKRAVIAGMSMGGFMALRLALSRPERVAGLVLVDSMADPHPASDRETYRGLLAELEGTSTVEDHLAEAAAHYLFGQTTHGDSPDLVSAWIDRWQTYPVPSILGEFESWLDRPGVMDRLEEIDVPTLVLHGEEDVSIPVERAERTCASLPEAELVTIPGAGHSSNLERPAVATAAIRDFLDAHH